MTLTETRDLASGFRRLKKFLSNLQPTELGMITLDDRITEQEALRDELLAASKMALKRKPFPVGALGTEQALETAVAKAEGEA